MLKKKGLSKFLDKVSDVRDLEIQFFNRGDIINFFLPNPPPPSLGPPPPPPPSDFFNIPNVPRINEFLNNNDFNFDFFNSYVAPAPNPLPLRQIAGNFFPNRSSTANISSNLGTNTTQTISGNHLIGELNRVI